MNAEEFLKRPILHPELCGCGCSKPLEENDPLGPQFMDVAGKRVRVNSDCYFDSLGEFIDDLGGVGGIGIHGPKNKCPIN